MKPITPHRFNALGGYARQPRSILCGEEIRYFEHADERLLGMVLRDLADNDFGGIVFGRDRRLRFRWVSGTGFCDSPRRAEVELRRELERVAALRDDEYYQGDETGKPVDFFTPVVPAHRLNPSFVTLRDEEVFSAAKGIIEEMMRWYEDADGNFVEQFQTTGFDARIWELYLFAVFREMFYTIDRTHSAPDFLCVNPGARFYVEAVTVNPTRDKTGAIAPEPEINSEEECKRYLSHYMPIKFGSPLSSKLARRYWDLPHVAETPLLFAIQDFSAPGSMLRSRSAFETYIYGYDQDWEWDGDGKLTIIPRKSRLTSGARRKSPRASLIYRKLRTWPPSSSQIAAPSRSSIVWDCSRDLVRRVFALSAWDLRWTTIPMQQSPSGFGTRSMIRLTRRVGRKGWRFGTILAQKTLWTRARYRRSPISDFWRAGRSRA
jgi:hypothetical protein